MEISSSLCSNGLHTETQDTSVQGVANSLPVRCEGPHIYVSKASSLGLHDCHKNGPSPSSKLGAEDDKDILEHVLCSRSSNSCGKKCSNFDDQGYIGKLQQFQSYVDKVERLARPGCSQELLSFALTSLSSIVRTLSVMSSKHYRHASL